MDKPRQRYPRSEARRLRPHPCPDCGRISRPRLSAEDPGLAAAEADPEVLVAWYCPEVTCNQHDGFFIESR